jgi:N-acetyl-gamma-glutamyl-phosphate reductase
MGYVPKLLQAGVKVVDFSADYRLHDVGLYERVYKVEHVDREHLSEAAFGLCELFRDQVRGARLVANPGCYPTAAALSLVPLVKAGLIRTDDIVVNAVSGATGAGRKAALPFHFPEMNENLFAYAVGTHRHQPEIEQIVADATGTRVEVLFQPHVVAIDRGIAESIYCGMAKSVTPAEVMGLFQEFYADEPFVRVLESPPKLKHIVQTNFVDIFPTVVRNKVVVFATIDNLTKGAAGQAVQNLNILCGLDETMGLI